MTRVKALQRLRAARDQVWKLVVMPAPLDEQGQKIIAAIYQYEHAAQTFGEARERWRAQRRRLAAEKGARR